MEKITAKIFGKFIRFSAIAYESLENPCVEDDGTGIIRMFDNGVDGATIKKDSRETEELLKKHWPYCIGLQSREHSISDISVLDSLSSGNLKGTPWFWDTSEGLEIDHLCDGFWIPNETLLADINSYATDVERIHRAIQLAQSACEAFTAWYNGWTYSSRVVVYRARNLPADPDEVYDRLSDYRHDEPVWEQNAGMQYGTASAEAALVELEQECDQAIKGLDGDSKIVEALSGVIRQLEAVRSELMSGKNAEWEEGVDQVMRKLGHLVDENFEMDNDGG